MDMDSGHLIQSNGLDWLNDRLIGFGWRSASADVCMYRLKM